jgi:hypothetical protein
VIYLIKNILDLDSVWCPWFVSEVLSQTIPQHFMGQTQEEELFLYCLTQCRLRKVPEVCRPHLYGGGNPRSRIKLSCNGRSVIN